MDDHLACLLASNEAWADAVSAADPDFFANSARKQAPKFLWIGCSDSRVPESVVTASKPGDIFAHRNIANQVLPDDDNVHAVLTYAVGTLKVEHILVVGHSHCGGVAAAYWASQNPPVPPSDSLTRWLAPLTALAVLLGIGNVQPSEAAITLLVEENVKAQVTNTAASVAVKKAWAERQRVWVHGLVYDLETGKLKDLGVSVGPGKC
ncbi:carbonic anhydrase [Vararia minispora EC-137]|uniref:Carbonic anhydrase n=1 Tax=Vararia minispora EC-137 TaxID=1314806 RepID=A0ACB8QXQ8_9AGAM|nr:carbonic anhydrase [Vararia minispora EC-137]